MFNYIRTIFLKQPEKFPNSDGIGGNPIAKRRV